MKTKNTPAWYKTRGYLHFDCPISCQSAEKIVTNPEKVASHAFYPLIHYSVVSKKIKKDKTTGKIIVVKPPKSRPISYASHIDSHIYAYYSKLLEECYEKELKQRGLEKAILAFRVLGKSNINFAYEAFESIKIFGECGAVALDLSKFFDTLDHNVLKKQWAKLINKTNLPPDHYNVFKSLTKYSKVDKLTLYEAFKISKNNPKNGRERICSPSEFRAFRSNVKDDEKVIHVNQHSFGIPQGSPISALLSNIYMIDFDSCMKEYVDKFNGKYFRYCDDMLFIVPISERDEVAGFVRETIKNLNLRVDINTKKTELRTFRNHENDGSLMADIPLQYLGFLFNGKNIYLRSSSLTKYSTRMKKGVRLAKATMRKRNEFRVQRNESRKGLFKKKLYRKYTHLGSRNFITYGVRAAEIMKSDTIKKQLKFHWRNLQKEIEK